MSATRPHITDLPKRPVVIDDELAAILALLRNVRAPANRASRRDGHAGRKRAVLYIRVSSKGQLATDFDPDGLSIPAQRDAGHKKATDLDADVVDVFIDRAETGTKLENRDDFLRMLAFLKTDGQIDYVIVPKVDRFARDRGDDAILSRWVRKHGAELVSCAENIDGTPSGQLVHGLMATLAEFYSANLRTEVQKGLRQKVKVGGTPGRAPIGYLNVRKVIDGREVRTVELDPDRAPLIRWAFQQYATGDWTVPDLCAALTAKGLTTRPGPKTPAKALHPNTLYAVLHNAYYMGVVMYEGAQHPGRHTPLVTPSLFLSVQALLTARDHGGSKRRKHDHYLKGSLFCGTCGERLCISPSKGRGGVTYLYAFCLGRHGSNTCTQPYFQVEIIEDTIENFYRSVQADTDSPTDLRDSILAFLADERAQLDRDQALAEKRLAVLRDEQLKLLQAHYAGAVPLELLKTEQERLTREIAAAEGTLSAAVLSLDQTEAAVRMAVDLAANCYTLYRKAPDSVRQLINQAFFDKLFVERDGSVRRSARTSPLGAFLRPDPLPAAEAAAVGGSVVDLDTTNPASFLWARGSSTSVLVGAAGIEPATARV